MTQSMINTCIPKLTPRPIIQLVTPEGGEGKSACFEKAKGQKDEMFSSLHLELRVCVNSAKLCAALTRYIGLVAYITMLRSYIELFTLAKYLALQYCISNEERDEVERSIENHVTKTLRPLSSQDPQDLTTIRQDPQDLTTIRKILRTSSQYARSSRLDHNTQDPQHLTTIHKILST
nr:hypothetical protein BgiMline_018115 [Biomphalaria glabrata]